MPPFSWTKRLRISLISRRSRDFWGTTISRWEVRRTKCPGFAILDGANSGCYGQRQRSAFSSSFTCRVSVSWHFSCCSKGASVGNAVETLKNLLFVVKTRTRSVFVSLWVGSRSKTNESLFRIQSKSLSLWTTLWNFS